VAEGRRGALVRSLKILILAAVGVVLFVALTPSASPSRYRAAGRPRPMPDEQLETVSAEEFGGILVGLRGRPVVVNVWASWCAPCRAEMPLLERASRTFDGEVVFFGVASRDGRAPAADFLQDTGVTYPNVLDESGGVRRELGLRGFPTTYIFDGRGDLVASVLGGISEQRLAAQIEEALRS
jgi:cytochrome c biogenesis protein CcmG, thiol:disulfide interchange protein DsbE